MKIQKDIRKNVFVTSTQEMNISQKDEGQPDESDLVEIKQDMQQSVDAIFEEADMQIAKKASRALKNAHPKLSKWKFKIGWSVIGFFLFVGIGLGVMGYKTYKHLENRWPGMREEAINRYQELQDELLSINDADLTAEAYYQKQYMLVLSAEDIRNIMQLGLTLEQIQQLKDMTKNNESTNISLLEILPEEKAIEFIKIMIAEKRAKELGEIVYIDTITDDDVQEFLADLQKQQNTTED